MSTNQSWKLWFVPSSSLVFFLSSTHTQLGSYRMYTNDLHTKQLLYYQRCFFSCLELHVSYDWWGTAPNTHGGLLLVCHFLCMVQTEEEGFSDWAHVLNEGVGEWTANKVNLFTVSWPSHQIVVKVDIPGASLNGRKPEQVMLLFSINWLHIMNIYHVRISSQVKMAESNMKHCVGDKENFFVDKWESEG